MVCCRRRIYNAGNFMHLVVGSCSSVHRLSRGGTGEGKAFALLKQWLSPVQLAQYENNGCFEVTGCHSGKRYRIRRARQMNIDELDEEGARSAAWCFGPEGNLPIGDLMLAPKISLENDERTALAVANRVLVASIR